MPKSGRPTLVLIALTALCVAVLAAGWFERAPLTTGAIAYIVTVATMARMSNLPPLRTLVAAVLLTIAGARLLLQATALVIEAAVWVLGASGSTGVRVLRKEAAA